MLWVLETNLFLWLTEFVSKVSLLITGHKICLFSLHFLFSVCPLWTIDSRSALWPPGFTFYHSAKFFNKWPSFLKSHTLKDFHWLAMADCYFIYLFIFLLPKQNSRYWYQVWCRLVKNPGSSTILSVFHKIQKGGKSGWKLWVLETKQSLVINWICEQRSMRYDSSKFAFLTGCQISQLFTAQSYGLP